MSGTDPHRRRPRPLADAPAADAVVLAKSWLLELVAAAPLEAAAQVPAAELAREGPGLCAAVVQALGSDEALDLLASGPLARRAGALAGARTPGAAIAAVEALRSAVSTVLRAELGAAPAALHADLADRLAHVCAVVAGAALHAGEEARDGVAGEDAAAAHDPGARTAAPRDAGADPPGEDAAATRDAGAPHDPGRGVPFESARADPLAAPLYVAASSSEPELTAEDRRAPHLAALERRLERQAVDGRPFALLCVEVHDRDRLLAADPSAGAELEATERELTRMLRPGDVLGREAPGRWWLVAPDTDRTAARALGEELAAVVADGPGLRGVPLRASVGLAVSPDDGSSAAGLLDHADEGVFAARAAGVTVA